MPNEAFEKALFAGFEAGERRKEFRKKMALEEKQLSETQRQRQTQEYGTLGTTRENIELAQRLKASGRVGPLTAQEQYATGAEESFQKRLSQRYGGRSLAERYSTGTLRQAIKDIEDRKVAGIKLDPDEEYSLDQYNRELQKRLTGREFTAAPKTKEVAEPPEKKGFFRRMAEGVGGTVGAAAGSFREKMKGPKPEPNPEDARTAARRRLGLK